MCNEATSARWILWTVLITIWGEIGCQNIAQGTSQIDTTLRDPITAKLALGSMLQGMLTIQVRPQGGHYEEKYKSIFPSGGQPNFVEEDRGKEYRPFALRAYINSTRDAHKILTEDGRLLEAKSMGVTDSPCFETERISRNKLLALLCSMRLQKEHPEKLE